VRRSKLSTNEIWKSPLSPFGAATGWVLA